MKEYKLTKKLMGSIFTLGVCMDSEEKAQTALQLGVDEIVRLEQLLSEFLSNSETSLINTKAHDAPQKISSETFDLINRSLTISQLTEGDFDITVSPLKNLYNFKNQEFKFPTKQQITSAQKGVGYHHLVLSEADRTIYLTHPDTKISFSAIGKGFASEKVKDIWLTNNVTSGYINASGDLTAFGTRPDGQPWQIGIANPDNRDEMILYLPIQNAAVATSGDYEQYFIYKGEKYAHTINPHTAKPIKGIKSVTVISSSAELSDALSTAIFVKGCDKGIKFANQLPNTHCIIIDEYNQLHFSKHLNYEPINH